MSSFLNILHFWKRCGYKGHSDGWMKAREEIELKSHNTDWKSLITMEKTCPSTLTQCLLPSSSPHSPHVSQVIELYRLLAVGISLWNQFAVPVLFSVFWFVLFVVQLCSDAMSANASTSHQGILFFLLTRCDEESPLCFFLPVVALSLWLCLWTFSAVCSVSECCATPYSLLGLTFVVSYLALGLLNLCKFYLGGYAAVQNENVMHRWVHLFAITFRNNLEEFSKSNVM